jgi:hypothetical protein
MLEELQISPFCAPQRMDAEIPDAAHSGGSARGYQAIFVHSAAPARTVNHRIFMYRRA